MVSTPGPGCQLQPLYLWDASMDTISTAHGLALPGHHTVGEPWGSFASSQELLGPSECPPGQPWPQKLPLISEHPLASLESPFVLCQNCLALRAWTGTLKKHLQNTLTWDLISVGF